MAHLVLIILAALALDAFIQYQLARQYRNDQHLDVSLRLSALRANLEKEITGDLLLVQGTASFISVTPDLTHELFSNYAQRVLEKNDLVKNLGVAPDFILKYVYPMEGNEAIIGTNYKELPKQWEQVRLVAKTGEMVIAGPLKLIQGGTGLIGRAPVFVFQNNSKHLWGIVSSVIDMDRLFHRTGLDAVPFEIGIRGVNGLGSRGDVFWGRAALFEVVEESIHMPVTFPSGSWVIAGKPFGGWAVWHPQALYIHGLSLFLAVSTAILTYRTNRRNAQIDQTRKSLDISQAIAHLGSWEMNHVSEILWWSDEVYRIFGLSPAEGSPSLDFFLSMVHPEDQEKVESAFAKSLQSCGGYTVDHRIVRRDGTVRHVQERGSIQCDHKGNPVVSRGTVLDITERVLAEQASKANEERLLAMSEASHDALVMIDSDDRIMFWSRAAEKMFGWERSEALGQKMHLLIAPEKEREMAWEGLKHFAGTGQGPVIGSVAEFTALRRDGTPIPVERSVSAFQLGDSHYAVGTIRDITERKIAEEELRAFSDRLELASQAGQIGVWEWSVKENRLVWDHQMYALYAFDEKEFSGLYDAWRSRVHPEDVEQAEKSLMEAVEVSGIWDWEFRVIWPNNETRYIKAAALTRRDEDNGGLYMTGVNWDVTESRKAQEQLRLLATTDSLTGLFNRRHFMEASQREIERSRRYDSPFTLIMFDVDKFKAVNDTYGHDVGDLVLQTIAARAGESIRDVDVLGRVGGEEFAIILPQTDLEAGLKVAEKLRAAMERSTASLPDGGEIDFTVSLGVAGYSEHRETLEAIIKAADTALYRAKENGRNRVEVAQDDPAGEA